MAKKRDMLDDLIDIQNDWQAVSHPMDGIADSLVASADPNREVHAFDPADYKERPRPNSILCVNVAGKNPDLCHRCMDVCPTNAIKIKGANVRIDPDDCRKCGLCVGICPTEVFQLKNNSKALYDKIARAASAHEQCYITCTRALRRDPEPNEILLPCVGMMSRELWFAVLTDFDNLSVYLPLGICDRCRTVTGEEAYSDAISQAEEWTGEAVGLEVDASELTHEQSRAYKRSQFMSNMTQSATRMVTRTNAPLAGAAAVAKRVQDHSKKLTELQKSLEKAVGATSSRNKRRLLQPKRKLMIAALTEYPPLAKGVTLEVPECDVAKCTMCGDCAQACPLHACELDNSGHFQVEDAYCLNCGACAAACPEDALTMVAHTADELVIIDEESIRRQAEAKAKADAAKQKSRETLQKGLDVLEGLAENED